MAFDHLCSTHVLPANPQDFIDTCAREMAALDIAVRPRDSGGVEADVDGVRLTVSGGKGGVRIALAGETAQQVAAVRVEVQDRLARLDPTLQALDWDTDARPGDYAPNLSFARVTDMTLLSDDFVRLELQGDDLARFATGGMHFRILRQLDPTAPPAWPRLNDTGTVDWPQNNVQLFHRVYTARYVYPEQGRIITDILRHDGGPTCAWAEDDPVGQTIGITGPGGGWMPDAPHVRLVGDETAQPAILRMLEDLPPETQGDAYVMAGAPGRESPVENRTQIRLHWLYRDQGDDVTGPALDDPLGDAVLWFAASKAQARTVRQHVRDTLALPRDRYTIAGYWQ